MAASISVHLYDFASPTDRDIGDALKRIAATAKGFRFRNFRGFEMALLDITTSASDNDVFLLDFVKRREVGPGRLGPRSSSRSPALASTQITPRSPA